MCTAKATLKAGQRDTERFAALTRQLYKLAQALDVPIAMERECVLYIRQQAHWAGTSSYEVVQSLRKCQATRQTDPLAP